MILLTFIILVLLAIIFFKAKKIKELNKNLLKKELMFFVLHEQRFESFLKIINENPKNIQYSIFMNIGELRKNSLFNKNNNKKYFIIEDNIQKLLTKSKGDGTSPEFIEINNHIEKLSSIIEETKVEYNNLIDEFNQEKNDFFGKIVTKKIKDLKTFNHI